MPGAGLLLQSPSVSKPQIALTYRGDIWIVDRSGADAHRPEFGPLPDPGNPAFIEADGSLRSQCVNLMNPCAFSQSEKRSVHWSTGKPCFFIPNPWPPLA